MKIYNVKREQGRSSNRYCGPSAISALTNLDTKDTAYSIRCMTGKHAVMGVHHLDLIKTLDIMHNIKCVSYDNYMKVETNKRPTLARWLKGTVKQRTSGRVFLVIAGNHYQLVSGRRYVCGITTEIVSIRDKKVKRRSRVKAVYEVFPKENG